MKEQRCPECGGRLNSNYCDICMRRVAKGGRTQRKYQDPWDYSSAHRQEEGHKCITFDAPKPVQRPKQTFSRTKQSFSNRQKKQQAASKPKTLTVVMVLLAIMGLSSSLFELFDEVAVSPPKDAYVETVPVLPMADIPNVQPGVLYEGNDVRITVDGAGLYYDEYALYFTIYNNSDRDITVNNQLLCVNDFMLSGALYQEVEKGEHIQTCMPIYSYELDAAGITQVSTVRFSLDIFDSKNYTNIANTGLVTLNTDAEGDSTQAVDLSGMEIYHDGKTCILLHAAEVTAYDEGKLDVFLVNTDERTVCVSTIRALVNDTEVAGGFWTTLLPGTRSVPQIYLYELDRADVAELEQIQTVTLELYVDYYREGYLEESLVQTVSFDPNQLF